MGNDLLIFLGDQLLSAWCVLGQSKSFTRHNGGSSWFTILALRSTLLKLLHLVVVEWQRIRGVERDLVDAASGVMNHLFLVLARFHSFGVALIYFVWEARVILNLFESTQPLGIQV